MSGTPYDINLQLQVDGDDLALDRVQQAVIRVLREHDIPPGTGLSLVLVDDDAVQRLNREFRQVDAPTDVLSFPADAPDLPDEAIEPYLGDLVLAVPYLRQQAAAGRHAVADELILAAVHGTLHLLGYDHDSAEHQDEMWAVQADALQAAGVQIEVPRFTFGDDPADGGSPA